MNKEEAINKQMFNVCHQNNLKKNPLSILRRFIGSAAMLFPLLTLIILIHVVLRYTLGINYVWLEELHWQLYAYLATLSVAFSFITNGHVRLDLLRHRFSQQMLRTVEAVGLMFFVVPFAGLISWYGFRSVVQSYVIGEHSVNAQGLPYTFIVKLALPLSSTCILCVAFIRLKGFLSQRTESTPSLKINIFKEAWWNWMLGVGVAISITCVGLAWWVGQIDPSYALVVAMFVSFVVLLFTGYPIAFVLGGIAVAFIFVGYATDYLGYTLTFDHPGTKLYLGSAAGFVNRIYGGLLRKPELVALPMFIFMGLLLDRSGMAKRMMRAMQHLFRRVRGGLAICVVLIGILLAASTGIIGASVVLLGLIGLPVMLHQGYSKSLATGTVCSA
ncbi:MAG: TRAP transporter large permease subunit, partial [Planctomycetaceae bacterium]|nr:TRAP transporter large permease subunit [Planctomycetaceae bacterium]